MTTTETEITTPYEAAYERALGTLLRNWAERNLDGAARARRHLIERIERDAKKNVHWGVTGPAGKAIASLAEETIAAETLTALSQLLLNALDGRGDAPTLPSEALRRAEDAIRRAIASGCDASWSGLFNNDVERAVGKGAGREHGRLSWMPEYAAEQAAREVAPEEYALVGQLEQILRESRDKRSAARSETSKDRLDIAIEDAKSDLETHRAAFNRAVDAAGRRSA